MFRPVELLTPSDCSSDTASAHREHSEALGYEAAESCGGELKAFVGVLLATVKSLMLSVETIVSLRFAEATDGLSLLELE